MAGVDAGSREVEFVGFTHRLLNISVASEGIPNPCKGFIWVAKRLPCRSSLRLKDYLEICVVRV